MTPVFYPCCVTHTQNTYTLVANQLTLGRSGYLTKTETKRNNGSECYILNV
jgi:hypothetical protein